MRFIDADQLEPKIRDLIPILEQAQKDIDAELDPTKRAKLIERHRSKWVALRPALESLSHGKCWYTECFNPGTDDDVDHFRPKGRIDEDRAHPGYYWLALDWHNFRLSCHRANRPRTNEEGITGGKSDHFPLVDPSRRARTPQDPIEDEIPCIFDPTDPFDPPMLSFNPNGEAALSPDFKDDPTAQVKFGNSIIYLNIDWPTFRDARVELYNQIRLTVQRACDLKPSQDPRQPRPPAFLNYVRDLIKMTSPKAQYSSAARIYIESFSDVWWVRQIVLKLIL